VGSDKRGEFKLLFYYLARCFTCYNIIKVDLDISGEINYFDLDGDYHECHNVNTDEFTRSRLVYDLFLELINTQHEDLDTGKLERSYYEQAKDLICDIPEFNPTPIFLVHLSDIRDDKIKQELANLEASTRKRVMKDSIGLIFESINAHYYNLTIRKLLRCKTVE
jgi:hypothetical protein